MRFLGIDPGQSGGFVLLDEKGYPLGCWGMPATEADLWQLLQACSSEAGAEGVRGYLERVRASPQMSKGSIWTFAQGYGSLRAFLIAAGIPFDDVAPARWQGFLGVRDKTGKRAINAIDSTEKKNRHKARAQQLFPMLQITHKIADAALIAEYGRRLERGFGADLPSRKP